MRILIQANTVIISMAESLETTYQIYQLILCARRAIVR